MNLLVPKMLKSGQTFGIATPSWPAHVYFKEKFEHGLRAIQSLGFNVKLGSLTAKFVHQGYRTGTPQERAAELMELFRADDVQGIITTIGGSCSLSTIEHLDFQQIRQHPKVFVGYSDITALHLAILKYAKLRTFYGPAVVPSFGEHPNLVPETSESFLDAVAHPFHGERRLVSPTRWSNQLRDASTDAWKTGERQFQPSSGWTVARAGRVEGPIVAVNLNTYINTLGTPIAPDLDGRILMLEEMNCALDMQERKLWQLKYAGVFDRIKGLIISKPEEYSAEGAPFGLRELVLEAMGDRQIPIMLDFDCGHTHPMLTIGQETRVRLDTTGKTGEITVLEAMVAP